MPRHPKAAMEALVEDTLLQVLGPRRPALEALVVETGRQALERLKALQAEGAPGPRLRPLAPLLLQALLAASTRKVAHAWARP